mgnify:CR=1 FL=1
MRFSAVRMFFHHMFQRKLYASLIWVRVRGRHLQLLPIICAAVPVLDIPHTLVDTRFVDGKDVTKNFPGYYVEVRDENAIYHVNTPKDGCVPTSLCVAKLALYRENYDPKNMMRYRNNVVYDFSANKMYIFDFNKNYRTVDLVDHNAEQNVEA